MSHDREAEASVEGECLVIVLPNRQHGSWSLFDRFVEETDRMASAAMLGVYTEPGDVDHVRLEPRK